MRKSTLVQLSVPGAAPRYRTGRDESPGEREEVGVQTADDLEKAVYEFAHICGVASKREELQERRKRATAIPGPSREPSAAAARESGLRSGVIVSRPVSPVSDSRDAALLWATEAWY